MCGKRVRKGKYLFFHCACLLGIISLGVGCATTFGLQERRQGQKHLEKAEELMMKGNYEYALKEDEKILNRFPDIPPGDSATFHMGLIWAHPYNPQRDYEKSLKCFQRVIRDFPKTRLRERARVWIYTIVQLMRSNNEIKNLKESVDHLIDSLKKHEDTISALKDTISALKEQLKELKEIDIVIEGKKREGLPKE
ncbi:MAG: hypothetical protein BA872_08220 [Desulfobacterales bacterium C00003060]|nr:MAG: hypothetical protein BA872_08220 [Desulfobacterales bacterium C00003060]OEU78106.1 MAG: hypothetical protein BA865_04225 [Desulfobacterales bacterium S5133MH4]